MTAHYDNYLSHHGIKGQKWGQRRYQNLDGSLTAEGRKHLGYSLNPKGNKKESSVKKLVDMAKSKRAEKAEAKKAEKEAAEKQKRMDYYRDHPEQMYRHRKELKPAEVDEIMRNVQFDKRLKDISQAENQRNLNTLQGMMKNASTAFQTVNGFYQTGKNVYNNIAEVNNAFVDMGVFPNGKKMQRFGEKADRSDLYRKLSNKNGDELINMYNKGELSVDDMRAIGDVLSTKDRLDYYSADNKNKRARKEAREEEAQQNKEFEDRKRREDQDYKDESRIWLANHMNPDEVERNLPNLHPDAVRDWLNYQRNSDSVHDRTTQGKAEREAEAQRKGNKGNKGGRREYTGAWTKNEFFKDLINQGRWADAQSWFPNDFEDYMDETRDDR